MRSVYLKTATALCVSLLSLGALASPNHDPAGATPTTGTYSANSLTDHNPAAVKPMGQVMAANEGNYNDTSRGMN